jgi:LPS export ABC transporter protein LptC
MKRLSTVFLVCFLLLLVGVGGWIAWTVKGRRVAAPVTAPAGQADYQIKEIHINETLEGNLRWTLDATQAEVFDRDQRTVMKDVVVRVYTREGVWTVTSDEGILDNAKRDVRLIGNVVVDSSDGLRLRTPELAWRNHERNLFTHEVVEIQQEGTAITGRGLEIRMQEERAVIGRNVRVVITNRANTSLSLFPRSGS